MAKSAIAATEFRMLGPIDLVRDGQALQLGGRRQRALLALLLLEPGRPVSSDRLIDELWLGSPPPGAEHALRVYVSRLRSALDDDTISAHAPGYALEIEADRIDAHRFEQLLRDGREALVRGAAGLAADRLGAALALWRGRALADVAEGGVLALEAKRLDELRLTCVEDQIEAELALGLHAELVPRLERLVGEEPLRERLWRQLVLALYRCERQADALAAYGRAQALLSAELGLEPSEELRALEGAVLRHEVAPASPAEQRHNLPAQLTSFVGRERELSDLENRLREHRLITLTGMGGAGKTRLALEAASRHRRLGRGRLARRLDSALGPGARARRSRSDARGPEQPDVLVLDAVREHLRVEECLLVLDNCEHLAEACGELVHEVLSAAGHVRVLATSRVALGIPGEVDYSVEPLPTPTDVVCGRRSRAVPIRPVVPRPRARSSA